MQIKVYLLKFKSLLKIFGTLTKLSNCRKKKQITVRFKNEGQILNLRNLENYLEIN